MKLSYLRNSLPLSLSPSPLLSSCLASFHFTSLPHYFPFLSLISPSLSLGFLPSLLIYHIFPCIMEPEVTLKDKSQGIRKYIEKDVLMMRLRFQRTYLLFFLHTRQCSTLRVPVCMCVSGGIHERVYSRIHLFLFLRKPCYKYCLVSPHTTCLRNILKIWFCGLTAS